MVDNPKQYEGTVLQGREACEGKKGRIKEVRSPEHPRNHLMPGLWEALIVYDGYIGKEGVTLKKLLNDEVRDWESPQE